ncbi:MAG: hypothetical protein MUE60_02640 [Candidatus Eisenbacteria bacterium]|jgi:hypothetical protein|nr:hypothetical protein [Candidatus Eisenbacteria bacterium]
MLDAFFQFSWPLIAAAVLLIGFGLGILYGRARATWRFEAELHEARDQAEWERARREQVTRELDEARGRLALSLPSDQAGPDAEAIVLRREMERLRQELQKTWEGQSEAHRRVRELEARISVLAGRQLRRTGSGPGGDHATLDQDGPGSYGKGSGPENVLSLWNTGGDDSPIDTAK